MLFHMPAICWQYLYQISTIFLAYVWYMGSLVPIVGSRAPIHTLTIRIITLTLHAFI